MFKRFNTDYQKNFDRDPRRQQELRMRPFADQVYRFYFAPLFIQRDHNKTLDIEHAVDVAIHCRNGMIITGQEKFLSHKYASFQSLTVEYHQNQFTQEMGDWFKLAAQVYFVGYANADDTGFLSWVLVNWVNLVIMTNNGDIEWHDNKNLDGKARASFRYLFFNEIPINCIIAAQF